VHKGRERRIDLAAGVGVEDAHPQAHRTRCRFHVSHRGLGDRRIVWFDQQGEARDSGNHLAQQLKPLGRYLSGEEIDPGQIAPGPGEACDQTEPDRVFGTTKTIGAVVVAPLAANAAALDDVVITATRRLTKSVASAGSRSS
jgi:hypothetical protein